LAEVTSRVTALVRGAGTHGHQDVEPRGAQDPGDVEPVTVAVLSSRAQEAAFVARALREAHLLGHVPWRDMAVVARSGAQVTALRSALVRLSVPVHVPGAELPVRSEPAVRPFLLAMRAVNDAEDPSRDADEPWLDEETVAELLTSVVGGLDALGLRRLRKLLREAELSSGGYRASGALLVEAVTASGLAATLPAHAAPQARALRTVTAVLEAGRGSRPRRDARSLHGRRAARRAHAARRARGVPRAPRGAGPHGGHARSPRDGRGRSGLVHRGERGRRAVGARRGHGRPGRRMARPAPARLPARRARPRRRGRGTARGTRDGPARGAACGSRRRAALVRARGLARPHAPCGDRGAGRGGSPLGLPRPRRAARRRRWRREPTP